MPALKKKKTGKGKKGKKGKKKVGKSEKESIIKEAIDSAKIWQMRFDTAEKSRLEYRESTRKLVSENDRLHDTVNQTERDTIEVIAFLKKEDGQKDRELVELRGDLRSLRQEMARETSQMTDQHQQDLEGLRGTLSEKSDEVRVMQNELKLLKEFRRKRAEMQQEIEKLQEVQEDTERKHKHSVLHMEERFFEEKMRLQKEANRRIAELAEKAHEEAVKNLEERTREVYKENLHMSEALALHMEEEASLRKDRDRLDMANRQLVAEKELNQRLVTEKIGQARHHKKLIKDLQEKVQCLEESLSMVVREFERDRTSYQQKHREEMESISGETEALRRRCALQERELSHIRRLARSILEQRGSTETFFLEALAHVKREIAANRTQYLHDAQVRYKERLQRATRGKGMFPLVRTFRAGLDTSTNSVFHDMEQAECWDGVGEHPDISQLTWEQKEQVLRLLFAKMNQKQHPSPPSILPPLPSSPSPSPSPSPSSTSGQTLRIEGRTGDKLERLELAEPVFLTQHHQQHTALQKGELDT